MEDLTAMSDVEPSSPARHSRPHAASSSAAAEKENQAEGATVVKGESPARGRTCARAVARGPPRPGERDGARVPRGRGDGDGADAYAPARPRRGGDAAAQRHFPLGQPTMTRATAGAVSKSWLDAFSSPETAASAASSIVLRAAWAMGQPKPQTQRMSFN